MTQMDQAEKLLALLNTTDGVSTYTDCVILGGTQAVPAGNIGHLAAGAGYFQGAPSAASLAGALPVTTFAPATADNAARPAGAIGYQALGAGGRAPSTWQAGAVEQSHAAVLI